MGEIEGEKAYPIYETCADWYDWIEIWLRDGNTKASMLEAFKEMIEEVEESVGEEGDTK